MGVACGSFEIGTRCYSELLDGFSELLLVDMSCSSWLIGCLELLIIARCCSDLLDYLKIAPSCSNCQHLLELLRVARS